MAEEKKHKVFLRWTPVDFSQPQINQVFLFAFGIEYDGSKELPR